MAVWNYYAVDNEDAFDQWAIVLDLSSKTYWYKVVRDRPGKASGNRTALWSALLIAHRHGLQMHAVLKDRRTKRCSLAHVFAIQRVLMEADGETIWLQLDASESTIGTPVREESVPSLSDVFGEDEPAGRSPKLTFEQYSSACLLARKVYEGEVLPVQAGELLHERVGLNRRTARALINNYRCMVQGKCFKSRMSVDALEYFIDEIITHHDSAVGDRVLRAVEGYCADAGRGARNELGSIVDRLREEVGLEPLLKLFQANQPIVAESGGSEGKGTAASEILREIWVRGPMHAAFRRSLKRRWNERCAVHGVACDGNLRASHIVAWCLDETLRGNVDNGLLLSVPLDSLFDQGWISFDDDGRMLVAKNLDPSTAQHFGLTSNLRLAWDGFSSDTRIAIGKNLQRHRELHGRNREFVHA